MTNVSSTVSIPLYVFPIPGKDAYKVGIKVSFDGKTFKMYEFDTGGSGFWAAGNSAWWSKYSSPTPDPGPQTINYSSGIQYTASPVITDVYFESPSNSGTPLTLSSVEVARITQAEKNGDKSFNDGWENALTETDPAPPLWGHFFGDFGMGLAPFVDKSTGQNVFFAMIPQLTQPLCNGYIIDIGPYPKATAVANQEGWVAKGSMQIGLAPGEADSFPFRFKMQPDIPATDEVPPLFPGSNMPTYCEKLLADATLKLTQGSSTPTSFSPLGVVFDTGAPSIEIHTGTPTISLDSLNPYLQTPLASTPNSAGGSSSPLKNQVQLALTAAPATGSDGNSVLQVATGNLSGLNQADATTLNLNPPGYINTGLVPFFNGQVLYDLENGVIAFKPYG